MPLNEEEQLTCLIELKSENILILWNNKLSKDKDYI